jgi:Flp pilus assembly protein TadG
MSPVPARFWRATGGATAVSFALMAGPLLLLAFGGAEFARMMWVREALHETAISTARCMGVLNTNCASGGAYSASGALAYLQTRASGWGISVPSGAVTLDRDAACAGVTGFSQVSIRYSFRTAAPWIFGGSSAASGVPLKVDACFPNNG